MENLRQQKLIIIVGTNGTGKTTSLTKLIDFYLLKEKRALLLDSDGFEQKFFKYDEINESDLKTFTGGKRIFVEDINFFDTFSNVFLNRLKPKRFNGLLAIDDGRVFLNSRDEKLLKILRRRRQTNMDCILVFHGLSEVPPSLWTFATDLILHYTIDGYKRMINNLPPDKVDNFINTVNRVNKNYNENKFYSELIRLR